LVGGASHRCRMPKKDKPPTAEEIAEMLGVAPEKKFKVDHEEMGKVRVCFCLHSLRHESAASALPRRRPLCRARAEVA
jgi:hypothetical protein